MPCIFVVEGDADIRELLLYALTSAGYQVGAFETGEHLWDALLQEKRQPDLLLLDIMLPQEDGLSILKKLRTNPHFSDLPIILLTAKSSENDIIKGLNSGADDYVSKPFRVMELLSRVRALLRRAQPQEKAVHVQSGNIQLDRARRTVVADGELVELTYKEYELLDYLLVNAGIVLSRNKIMQSVWGESLEEGSRTLDMHIRTLRKKLGAAGERIKTVRHIGYSLGE